MSGTFLVVTTGVYGGHINHVFLFSVFYDALTSWGLANSEKTAPPIVNS